ncbi:GntR family transcriptional regulator [Patulibacter defluvii]|uniref:GntR family transcriptional regulator n=1 Tax=Patulibacter defluvii TaxID=3095358 RepID=UPI002A7487DD|nr:GntR family transcriptional regulator [Patulibacter sp. DM4]
MSGNGEQANGDAGNGESVVERLTGEIANAIMVGEFAYGTWLRQDKLAAHFGTSRQPIREALRRLEVIGMVEALPNRGSRVTGPDPASIRDGYLIRAELEGLAAGLAAQRITGEELAELATAVAGFRTEMVRDFESGGTLPEARSAWIAAHNRFHELILDASHNERLAHMVRTLNVSLPRNVTLDAIRDRGELEEDVRHHEAILQALQLRSEQLATLAMREHIRRSGVLIARWFSQQRDLHGSGQGER